MKILHVHDRCSPFGGAERYLLDTCDALEEEGHEVATVSSSEEARERGDGRRHYFAPPSWGIRSGMKAWGAFRDILEKERPDVVNLHNIIFFVSPYVVERIRRTTPVVMFVHDVAIFCPQGTKMLSPSVPCPRPLGVRCIGCRAPLNGHSGVRVSDLLFMKYAFRSVRNVDRVIVSSNFMAKELKRNGVAAEKIAVLPLFTDTGSARARLPDDEGLIVYVGRLDPIKGVNLLIEALGILKGSKWKAEIAGEGDLMDGARVRVTALGLSERVRFLGNVPREGLADLYTRASVAVFPSIAQESFGLSGLEALSFGTPVVAFSSGGVGEWLKDRETGLLAEPGNVSSLASAIKAMLEDRKRAQEMGRNGRSLVERSFSKETHIRRLVSVYEEAARSRGSR